MLLDEYISGSTFEPLNKIIEQLNDNIVRKLSEGKRENSIFYLLKNGLVLKLTIEKDDFKDIYRFEIINSENKKKKKISFHFWISDDALDHDTTVSHKYYEFLENEVLYNEYSYKLKKGKFQEENSFALSYGISYDEYDKVKYEDKYCRVKAFINYGKKYNCELIDIENLEFLKLNSGNFQKIKSRR